MATNDKNIEPLPTPAPITVTAPPVDEDQVVKKQLEEAGIFGKVRICFRARKKSLGFHPDIPT